MTTSLIEYESEAEARGHKQHRCRFGKSAAERVKAMCRQCEVWGLPYSIFEIIEEADGEYRSLGNLDDFVLEHENQLLEKLENDLGMRRGSIRPLFEDAP